MAKYTEAQKKANEKYLSKFSEIKIRILPEFKKQIEETAQKQGMSVQAFVIDSVKQAIERE